MCSAELIGRLKPGGTARLWMLPTGWGTALPLRTFPVICDHEANKAASCGPGFFIVIWYAEWDMCPLVALDRREPILAQGGLRLGNVSRHCTGARPARINITDNVPTQHQE